MSRNELEKQYKKLLKEIEQMRMYDGRNKGVDVYVCSKCGKTIYTRYKDKGATPFTISCRDNECKGTMTHERTISEMDAMLNKLTVHNWVRPTLQWLDKQRKKGKDALVEHVLNGGLMLESEL